MNERNKSVEIPANIQAQPMTPENTVPCIPCNKSKALDAAKGMVHDHVAEETKLPEPMESQVADPPIIETRPAPTCMGDRAKELGINSDANKAIGMKDILLAAAAIVGIALLSYTLIKIL